MGAVALRAESSVEIPAVAATRGEVISRYRRLRAISKVHHHETMKFLSGDAVLRHARRLGLAHGKTLVVDDLDEMTFAFDLAIHTAQAGRSRAIDRYAASARLPPQSDEALVLEAMRHARFSVVHIERRHEVAGLIVRDVFRQMTLWLVDEGLESSAPEGDMLAMRFYTPDRFTMTAGVMVPFDVQLMEDVIDEVPQLGRKTPAEAADDRRFAEAIYRIALADGLTEQILHQDVPEAG